MTAAEDFEVGGSGGYSLAGYEYQIEVSVWLALDLVLVSALTNELVLEAPSEEDIEAELAEFEPSKVVSRAAIDGSTLVVQVKRRSTDAWTLPTFASLLKKGSKDRVSAAERLKDPKVRYLLVTTATVNGDEMRKLRVRKADARPKGKTLPPSFKRFLPADAAGRLAVLAGQDEERLAGDIVRLLTVGCRVPASRTEQCLAKLRQEARARILGAAGGRWTRPDLEDVIRAHEGYLASAPELEHYVHPTNWDDLKAAMRKDSAAFIIGQSGTGKTLATKMLYQELRDEFPGLSRVTISHGPEQLRNDATLPPVLYDIEDPWGRFDFDPKSRPWNDQLARFLADARPDRMVVVTSRRDVAQASTGLKTVTPWLVPLEAESYGAKERAKLYRTRIASLPRELQTLAQTSERAVLEKLSTPLEIQKFFDALRTLDRDGLDNPRGFVAQAIAQSHHESIELTVVDQIEERDDIAAASVIWGLLKANDKLSRSLLRQVEDGLADRFPSMEKGVSPLADFFVAARNLRQSGDGVLSYYHPRVEAGIEQALDRHRAVARRTLRQLVELLAAPDGPGLVWGSGAAARLLAAARKDFAITPSSAAVMAIDSWLETHVADPAQPLGEALDLAAGAGSGASNAAEIARYILYRPDRSFGGFLSWGPPEHPEQWYADRRSNPATRPLVERFIREILPTDRSDYDVQFATEIRRLAPDLSGAFLDAAARAVHFGYIPTDDVIAEGALEDLDGFETIVDEAVKVRTPSEKDRREWAQIHLDIRNGVYSDDYAQHIGENDDGYTAGEFLKAYVRRARRDKGWRFLAQHRHAKDLTYYWLTAIGETAPANDGELGAAVQLAFASDDERWLWDVASKHWDPDLLPLLLKRVREGHANRAVDHDALACLLDHAMEDLRCLIDDLVTKGDDNRLAEIAMLLDDLRRRGPREDKETADRAGKAVLFLPAEFAEIAAAQSAVTDGDAEALPSAAGPRLLAINPPGEQVRRLRLRIDAVQPLAVEDDVRWGLGQSGDDDNTARLAIEAAVRHGMSAEVEAALDHRFADVVAPALTAVATPVAPPLPQKLLDFASHRASPVRKALVAILKAKPDARHLPTLLTLADDRWSKDDGYYGAPGYFPIARSAVDAIADLAPLIQSDAQRLLALGAKTTDQVLRQEIFTLLAKTGGVAMESDLFDLAVRPGSGSVRKAAADALLFAADTLDSSTVEKITSDLVITRVPRIAAVLALIAGHRADVTHAKRIGADIAGNAKRRALALLVAFALKDRDPDAARWIAALFPAKHPAVIWALGGTPDEISDAIVADLGEPAVCEQLLSYMRLTQSGE